MMPRNRILSFVLSVALIGCFVPVAAYAEVADDEQAANVEVTPEPTEDEMNDNANSWRYVNGERVYPQDSSEQSRGTIDGGTDGETDAGILPLATYEAWSETDEGTYVSSNGSVISGAIAKGVDVSEWDGRIDWEAVKAAGIDFVIIRCGYGMNYTSQDDKWWDYNVSECERLGIAYGVYLYSYATDTSHASSEADHVIRLLQGHHPTYPVYYDLEESSMGSTSNRSLLASIASTFCNKVQAAGYDVGVYASLNWWNNYLTDPVFDQWDHWVAQWNYRCDYTKDYTIWQSTSDGSVSGINGRVDVNFWINFDGESSQSYTRVSGTNRYETARAVAKEAYPAGCDTAVVTAGEEFADALSGSSLAGIYDVPILLTESTVLTYATSRAIQELGVETIYIVGGTDSVSASVEDALVNLGCEVTRIAGATREETAFKVYEQGIGLWTDTALVATAYNYPDALSAASYSFAKNAPIFLVGGALTDYQADALSDFSRVIVCGGTSSVSAQLGDDIKALDVSVKRVAGTNRYATATAFAKFVIDEGMTIANGGVASGLEFADALAAAPLLGRNNGVLLLASNIDYTDAKSLLAQKNASSKFYVIGGARTLSRITVCALKP